MGIIQPDADRCNNDTAQEEFDSLFIHSAAVVQHCKWDAWAKDVVEILTSKGDWVARKLGRSIHLQHRSMIGGTA